MKLHSFPLTVVFFAMVLLFLSTVSAEDFSHKRYRNWGFLAEHLHSRGMSLSDIRMIFLDQKRMPAFDLVPFAVEPKESERIYSSFTTSQRLKRAKSYLAEHETSFRKAEKLYFVPREVVAAILLIETDFGRYTGNYPILPRLARLANAGSPWNVERNYRRLVESGEVYTKDQVAKRGAYLLELFTPEVEATLRIAKQRGFDPFSIKGSYAGAFGYCQFLPHSFERFAVDGNEDGVVSLFQHPDAILSVASFLSFYRGEAVKEPGQEKTPIARSIPGLDEPTLSKAIFSYNRSAPYVQAVLDVAKALSTR